MLQLNRQNRTVPPSFLGQPVIRQNVGPDLILRQIFQADGRHSAHSQQLCGGDATVAGDNHSRAIYKNRIGEAESADALRDLTNLVFGMGPRVPRVRDKILNFLVDNRQLISRHLSRLLPVNNRQLTYRHFSKTREAEVENVTEARRLASDALALALEHDSQILGALTFARAGDATQAAKMADELAKRYAEDTLVSSYWLPSIRASVEIRRNNPGKAVEILQAVGP